MNRNEVKLSKALDRTKKYFLIVLAIMLVAFSSCKETSDLSDYKDEIIGTYQYTGNSNGMAIYSETHFIFVPKMDTVSTKVDSLNIGENVPNQILVEAGTWSLQDSIVTHTFIYHSDLAKIGTSMRAKIIIKGNNGDAYVLGENDEVLGKASAIKLD